MLHIKQPDVVFGVLYSNKTPADNLSKVSSASYTANIKQTQKYAYCLGSLTK